MAALNVDHYRKKTDEALDKELAELSFYSWKKVITADERIELDNIRRVQAEREYALMVKEKKDE